MMTTKECIGKLHTIEKDFKDFSERVDKVNKEFEQIRKEVEEVRKMLANIGK